MAEIILPASPTWRRASPRYIDYGVDQKPSTGAGVSQRLGRLGSHWALDVVLPPVKEGPAWLEFQVAFLRARDEGACYAFPQPGLDVGDYADIGAPIVRDAGQTGSTLILTGFALTYQVQRGQFLSLLAGGKRYLHQVAAQPLLPTSTGDVALNIRPMLRAVPDHLFAVEMIAPFIYGSVTGNVLEWDHETHPFVMPSFSIEEVR